MKALQNESKGELKDMYKGQEGKGKSKSVKISPPIGLAMRLVQSWLRWWSQTRSIGWCGKFQRSGGRNPWNTKSMGFLYAQVYICPGTSPGVGSFTVSDVTL